MIVYTYITVASIVSSLSPTCRNIITIINYIPDIRVQTSL